METRITGPDDAGRRLDRVLRRALPDIPLSALSRLLRLGAVTLDGRRASASTRVEAGQVIAVRGQGAGSGERGLAPGIEVEIRGGRGKLLFARTEAAPNWSGKPDPRAAGGAPLFPLLLETPDLLALNKPAGLATHGPGSLQTLVDAYLAGRLPASLSFRSGPLHRLDRPTSGLALFSKSLAGARRVSALLREGRLVKRYLALVDGSLDGEEVWEDGLVRDAARRVTLAAAGGKRALTRARPLERRGGSTLILAEIATGRTHQIRAQAAAHGHPLTGDAKYGSRAALPAALARAQGSHYFLHAWQMVFPPDAGLAGVPETLTAPPAAGVADGVG